MLKIRFPKEKPSHTERLNKAMSSLSACERDMENILKVYNEVSACAEEGSPRASYIKACMLYVDEAEPGDYREDILNALGAAIKGKYPLAYGLKADYLMSTEESSLAPYLRTVKYDDAQVLYCEGGLYADYFSGGKKLDRQKAYKLFKESAKLFLEYDGECRRGVREFTDTVICIGNKNYYSEQAAYSFRMGMNVYSDMDDKANKAEYLSAYEQAQKYGSARIKFFTTYDYARDCMDNVMGMHSLKTVNALMQKASAQYASAGDGGLKEKYEKLRELYDEFYDFEKRRLEALGEVAVYTTADYGKDSSLSVGQFASAVGNRLQAWANTPSEEPVYTVTAGNEEYTLNSRGEMVDKYGQTNGLKVDTTSKRVYDENNNFVGYFDSLGGYHKI